MNASGPWQACWRQTDRGEMAQRLDGKQLAGVVEQSLKALVDSASASVGRPPGLAVLRVGDDPASAVYVANKEKACGRIGVASFGAHLAAGTSPAEVLRTIEGLSQAETAAVLSISEKAVETRLYRARSKLLERLGGR